MSFTRKMLVGRKIGCTIAAGCSSRSEFRCILLSRNTQGGVVRHNGTIVFLCEYPCFLALQCSAYMHVHVYRATFELYNQSTNGNYFPTCICIEQSCMEQPYIGQHSDYIINHLLGIISHRTTQVLAVTQTWQPRTQRVAPGCEFFVFSSIENHGLFSVVRWYLNLTMAARNLLIDVI